MSSRPFDSVVRAIKLMRATEQTLEHELAPILGERLGASIVTQGSHGTGRHRGQSDTILRFPGKKEQ